MDFLTKAAALAKRDELAQRWGDEVVACVMPVYLKPPNPTSKAAKRRSLEALGWPVQTAPAKPKRGR
jgi:hypothetical protein